MPKTRSRVDKKSGITFRLVHRSQHDPLIADETAPQHVLQEVGTLKEGVDRKEEQIKYGVYFDDEYDYLKHLKSREEFDHGWEMIEEKKKVDKSKLNLPSSVFPSIIEEDVGMLNKAAPVSGPQLDVDPEIVQAMDDDFDLDDPNNQLTDDYLAEILEGGLAPSKSKNDEDDEDEEYEDADEDDHEGNDGHCEPGYSMARFTKERFVYDNGEQLTGNGPAKHEGTESDSDEERDDFPSQDFKRNFYSKDETKSVFTDYSLTSSILPRNEGLSLIDEKFETMFEREYGNDMDMGALDLDDIEGTINPNKCEVLKKMIEEEEDMKRSKILALDDKMKTLILDGEESDEDSDERAEKDLVQLEIELDAGKHRERLYDCESVLSTYSTLYNHPKVIRTVPRISKKLSIDPVTGIVKPTNTGLTKKNLRELDSTGVKSKQSYDDQHSESGTNCTRASRITELSARNVNETPEERKARKAAFKELKRERRVEKKANQTAFKMESDNQKRDMVRLRSDVVTMKLI